MISLAAYECLESLGSLGSLESLVRNNEEEDLDICNVFGTAFRGMVVLSAGSVV